MDGQMPQEGVMIGCEELSRLMPMHLCLSSDGADLGCGPTLQKLVGSRPVVGAPFFDAFEVRRPDGVADIDALRGQSGRASARCASRGGTPRVSRAGGAAGGRWPVDQPFLRDHGGRGGARPRADRCRFRADRPCDGTALSGRGEDRRDGSAARPQPQAGRGKDGGRRAGADRHADGSAQPAGAWTWRCQQADRCAARRSA